MQVREELPVNDVGTSASLAGPLLLPTPLFELLRADRLSRLAYVQPSIGENQWGNPSITYWGVGVNKKWQILETYGGKLVENIVQAIARDLLTHALHTLDKAGHKIVMHVHDEAVIDELYDSGVTVESVCKLMAAPPA